MELQFYAPGYLPQLEGFGCTATQCCGAMTIDGRTLDQNAGVENTAACNNHVLGGPKPINWAYVTTARSPVRRPTRCSRGRSITRTSARQPQPQRGPADEPGVRILIHLHDTRAGFRPT
jgi:hypothetical protein